MARSYRETVYLTTITTQTETMEMEYDDDGNMLGIKGREDLDLYDTDEGLIAVPNRPKDSLAERIGNGILAILWPF